jgi:hypothetical protein
MNEERPPNAQTKSMYKFETYRSYLLHKSILQHFANNLGRLLVSLEQLLALLALGLDGVVFVQKFLEQVLLVQRADQSVLNAILRVVDQKMHDGLGYLIRNCLTNNVEVRGNEATDEFRLQSFTFCECGSRLWVGGLRQVSRARKEKGGI